MDQESSLTFDDQVSTKHFVMLKSGVIIAFWLDDGDYIRYSQSGWYSTDGALYLNRSLENSQMTEVSRFQFHMDEVSCMWVDEAY